MRPVKRSGFTLLELLTALGVITLLLGLLLPALQHVRAAADKLSCASNLRQIGLAAHLYHGDFGHLPPHRPRPWMGTPDGFYTWNTLLLPYLEQDALWARAVEAFRQTPNVAMDPPHVGLGTVVKIYVCPTDRRLLSPFITPIGLQVAFTSYLGVCGGIDSVTDGCLGTYPSGPALTDIRDGASFTLMAGERPPPDTFVAGFLYHRVTNAPLGLPPDNGPHNALPMVTSAAPPNVPCAGPFGYGPGRTDNPCDRFHFWSLHPRGGNFVFADASVRFMRYSAAKLMVPLATRDGDEPVELPDDQ